MTDRAPEITRTGAFPTLERFFRWWFGTLASMVPGASDTRQRALEKPVLLVRKSGSHLSLFARRGRRLRALATIDSAAPGAPRQAAACRRRAGGAGRRVVLRLPSDAGLVSELSLPMGAATDLDSVLAFELSRQTPFQPGQVFFGHRVTDRDSKARTLKVTMGVVPKATVAEDLATLAALGLAPSWIELGDDDRQPGAVVHLDDRRPKPAPSSGRRRWLVNAAMAVLLVAAAGYALAKPIIDKRAVLKALAAQEAAFRADAFEAGRLRDTVAETRERATLLHDLRRRRLPATAVLDMLSRRLPDGTWLTALELDGDSLMIRGLSSKASALIAALEAAPVLSEVAFRAKVTRDEQTGIERFQIAATVSPVVQGEAGSEAAANE